MATEAQAKEYLKSLGYASPSSGKGSEIEGAQQELGKIESDLRATGGKIDTGGKTLDQIKADLEKFFPQTPAPTKPVITSTSNPEIPKENKTKADLTAILNNEPNYQEKINQSTAYLDNYMAQLEARRASEIAGINAGFEETKRQTEKAQTREKGATSVSLARIGGYLGGTASGTGAMLNLAESHRNELGALESKRQAAIQAANNAIDDKQFELARLKTSEARQIMNDIEDRKQKFFQNNLALLQEERAQKESERKTLESDITAENVLRDDARNSLSLLMEKYGGFDFSSLDKNTVKQIENLANLAGIPIESIQGPTITQTKEEEAQKQREISNAISIANLNLSKARFNLDVKEKGKITDVAAQRLGLPRQLVGSSESQLEQQLKQSIAPQWFIDFKTEIGEINSVMKPEEINKKWNSFRQQVVTASPLFNFFGGIGSAPSINPEE